MSGTLCSALLDEDPLLTGVSRHLQNSFGGVSCINTSCHSVLLETHSSPSVNVSYALPYQNLCIPAHTHAFNQKNFGGG